MSQHSSLSSFSNVGYARTLAGEPEYPLYGGQECVQNRAGLRVPIGPANLGSYEQLRPPLGHPGSPAELPGDNQYRSERPKNYCQPVTTPTPPTAPQSAATIRQPAVTHSPATAHPHAATRQPTATDQSKAVRFGSASQGRRVVSDPNIGRSRQVTTENRRVASEPYPRQPQPQYPPPAYTRNQCGQ